MNPALYMLDVEPSQFTTMMQKLSGPKPPVVVDDGGYAVGDILRDVKKSSNPAWRVTGSKLRNPDDWLDTSRVLTLDRPWSPSSSEIKVEWMEGELLPRLDVTRITNNLGRKYGITG